MGYLEQSTSKKASAVAGRAYGSASLSEPPRSNNRREPERWQTQLLQEAARGRAAASGDRPKAWEGGGIRKEEEDREEREDGEKRK